MIQWRSQPPLAERQPDFPALDARNYDASDVGPARVSRVPPLFDPQGEGAGRVRASRGDQFVVGEERRTALGGRTDAGEAVGEPGRSRLCRGGGVQPGREVVEVLPRVQRRG